MPKYSYLKRINKIYNSFLKIVLNLEILLLQSNELRVNLIIIILHYFRNLRIDLVINILLNNFGLWGRYRATFSIHKVWDIKDSTFMLIHEF
jgi:hypothetical protein